MIYLVDALCSQDHSIKFHNTLGQSFSMVKKSWQEWEAHCSLESMFLFSQHKKDLWIVVCDNTPFCFPILRSPLTRRGIDPENTFFVYYEYFQHPGNIAHLNFVMDTARHALGPLYQEKGCLNAEKLNSHLFVIDSRTNEGMELLVDAIKCKKNGLSQNAMRPSEYATHRRNDMSIMNFAMPVSYTMKVSPLGGKEKITLEFRHQTRRADFGSKGLDGYTYSYNGRTYRDTESLRVAPMEEISKNVFLTADAYGEKVLRTYTQIPTFDSGDREWDSMELEYLFFDGKHIHLVVMRGGYRIAKLTFYEQLLSADISLKPLFEKLGWPTDNIRWN